MDQKTGLEMLDELRNIRVVFGADPRKADGNRAGDDRPEATGRGSARVGPPRGQMRAATISFAAAKLMTGETVQGHSSRSSRANALRYW
jgi:hypothetical protein